MPRIRPIIWEICHLLSCGMFMSWRLRIRWSREGELPQGATLILAKHASSWDIPLVAHMARVKLKKRPYFQMGSFVGYRVLGPLVPLLNALGGFSVMRPKEVRRLQQKTGQDRRSALETMRRVNQAAEAGRRALLQQGEALVVFPEATREDAEVLPLKSELELTSAREVVREGTPVMVWPVVLSFGSKERFRRRVKVHCLTPFALDPEAEPKVALAQVEAEFRKHWVESSVVDSEA